MGLRNANLTQFSIECFRIAESKGWWDDYPLTEEGDPPDAQRRLSADIILSKLMLMVTEVAEATEVARMPDFDALAVWADISGGAGSMGELKPYSETEHGEARKGGPLKPEGFGIELADVIIRVLDLCRALGIDIQRCYELKTAYNESRPHRHGGKRA